MGGKARLLCALLLVLLCVAAGLQGAWCRGGHGGGGGGGHGGGGGSGHGGGNGDGGGGGRGGGGFGRDGGGFMPWPHGRSDAAEPRGRDVWRVSGAATTFAAAALVWWL